MQPAIDSLASVGVSVKDMSGEMRPVTDILEDLALKWDTLNAEQQQNLGVTLAGRFQVSRFLTLMQQWDTATQVTTTSLESQGSAMREQQEYSESLEARLNRLSNAGTSLSQSMGDAFLSDGIVVFTEAIAGMANEYEDLIEFIGFLPPTLGAAGVAVTAFSSNIRGMGTALLFGTSSMDKAKVSALGLEQGMTRGAVATATLKTALRGLATATIVGIAFAAVGFAIEKLTSAIGGAIKRQKELEEQTDRSMESLSKEKDNVEDLVDRYEKLSNINRNNQQEEEYVNLQNELAELLPTVKIGEDEKGNAILANTDIIRDNIAATERMLELERANNRATASGTIESNRGKIQENNTQLDEYENELRKWSDEMANSANDYAMSKAEEQFNYYKSKFQNLSSENIELIEATNKAYESLVSTVDGLSSVDISWVGRIATDMQYSKVEAEKLAQQVATVRNELGGGFSLEGLDANSINSIVSAINSISDSANMSTVDLARVETELRKNGVSASQASQAISVLTGEKEKLASASTDSANAQASETDAMSDNTEATWENASASDMLFGVTADQISQAQQAIQVVATLSQMENLNAQQKRMLTDATAFLANMYPELSGNIAANINTISSEITAMADLNDASGNNAYTMMSNQDAVTMSTIEASNQRILALQKEARALQDIVNSHVETQKSFGDGNVASNGFINHVINKEIPKVNAQLSKARSTRRDVTYGNFVPSDYKSNYSNSPRYSGSSSGSSSGGSGGSSGARSSSKEKENQKDILDAINSQIDAYERKAKMLNDNIAIEEYHLDQYEKTDKGYRERQKNIAKLKKQQANYQKDTINYINDQINGNKRLNKEQRNELKDTLISTKETYYSTLSEINSINQEIKDSYKAIADEIVEVYKEAYEKQQEIALSVIDNELKALEDSHSKKINMLDEEISAYEEVINKKIESLDKDKENADYQEKLEEMQKERLETQRQIDLLSRDSSMQAQSRVRDLEDQLRGQDKEISDYQEDRELELRKESLNSQLDEKQNQIDQERELENSRYDQQKSQLETDKENIQQYYEDLINNDREFARMREQILNGNVSAMSKTLRGFSKDINNNMEIIGRSISNNLIDKISEANSLLGNVNIGYSVMTNSTKLPNNIQQFDTGGYTGDFSGGKLGILDEKELILNKSDTKNLIEALGIVRDIPRQNLQYKTAQPQNQDNSKNTSFYVENLHVHDVQDRDSLLEEMNDGLEQRGFQFKR